MRWCYCLLAAGCFSSASSEDGDGVTITIRRPLQGMGYAPGLPILVSPEVELGIGSCAALVRANVDNWTVCYGASANKRCVPVAAEHQSLPLLRSHRSHPVVTVWVEHTSTHKRCGSANVTLQTRPEFVSLSDGSSADMETPDLSDGSSADMETPDTEFASETATIAAYHRSRADSLHATHGIACSRFLATDQGCQCPAVDVQSRSLTCNAPKSLSKILKIVSRKLANESDYHNMRKSFACPTPGVAMLSDLSGPAATVVLSSPSWRRFTFVRDPFARLLSFYLDYTASFGDAGVIPARLDRRGDGPISGPPTFGEFVHRVAAIPDVHANEHFASQAYLCGLHSVQYDDVGYWAAGDLSETSARPFLARLCERHGRAASDCTSELSEQVCAIAHSSSVTPQRCYTHTHTTGLALLDAHYTPALVEAVRQRFSGDVAFVRARGLPLYGERAGDEPRGNGPHADGAAGELRMGGAADEGRRNGPHADGAAGELRTGGAADEGRRNGLHADGAADAPVLRVPFYTCDPLAPGGCVPDAHVMRVAQRPPVDAAAECAAPEMRPIQEGMAYLVRDWTDGHCPAYVLAQARAEAAAHRSIDDRLLGRRAFESGYMALCDELTALAAATGEPLEGNLFLPNRPQDFAEADLADAVDLLARKRQCLLATVAAAGGAAARVGEIGFNAGHSAAMLLTALPKATLVSFDLCAHRYTRSNFDRLRATFGDRLDLVCGDSATTVEPAAAGGAAFDAVFVDGGHLYSQAKTDIDNMRRLAKPGALVIVDDCVPDADGVDRMEREGRPFEVHVSMAFRHAVAAGVVVPLPGGVCPGCEMCLGHFSVVVVPFATTTSASWS